AGRPLGGRRNIKKKRGHRADPVHHRGQFPLPQLHPVQRRGAGEPSQLGAHQCRDRRRLPAGHRAVMTTAVAPRERWLAHGAMLAFSALIAGSFSSGALAVPYIHPIPLNAVRFVLASAIMGVVAFRATRTRFALPLAPWRFGVMGVLMAAYFVTQFIALTMTQPVATSAVYTLVPLMT